MDVFLIRHAHAGSRTFGSHDRYRTLSDEGMRQADQLADFFAAKPLAAVYSSPATRCVQTVEPMATNAGLAVVEHDDLWEDVGLDQILTVVDDACENVNRTMSAAGDGDSGVAICSHGNLIPAIVEHLAHTGVPTSGRGCERASIWSLRRDENGWVNAQYLTPRSLYQG